MNAARRAGGWLTWPILIGLWGLATILPSALGDPALPPDSIEYLAIANAWVHGSGFVDPIQYNYYLQSSAPLPAFAVRAPVVPVLLALPLWLGARAKTVLLLHALGSIAIMPAAFVIARRFLSAPAAAAAVVLTTSTLPWLAVSVMPLTEVVGYLAILLVLATAPGVLRSSNGALLCAGATAVAWLTRPNLGILLAAVVTAAIWQLGPRRALRHRPLFVYAAAFAVIYAAIHELTRVTTGLAPYAGYAVALEHLSPFEWENYDQDYRGVFEFLRLHGSEIPRQVTLRARQLFEVLCLSPLHNGLGWVVLAGSIETMRGWRRVTYEQAICLLTTAALVVVIVVNYADFDPYRYPIPLLATGLLAALMAADHAPAEPVRKLLERPSVRWGLGAAGLALLLALAAWRAMTPIWPPRGTRQPPAIASACRHLEPDARVAIDYPWDLHWYCGNAVIRLPRDVGRPGVLGRFLEERRPRYVIGPRSLARFDALEAVAHEAGATVFAVRNSFAASDPWHAPAALACVGAEKHCSLVAGRLRYLSQPAGAADAVR